MARATMPLLRSGSKLRFSLFPQLFPDDFFELGRVVVGEVKEGVIAAEGVAGHFAGEEVVQVAAHGASFVVPGLWYYVFAIVGDGRFDFIEDPLVIFLGNEFVEVSLDFEDADFPFEIYFAVGEDKLIDVEGFAGVDATQFTVLVDVYFRVDVSGGPVGEVVAVASPEQAI